LIRKIWFLKVATLGKIMSYAGILLEKNGRYLLQLRDKGTKNYSGCWGLFGGGIENGESSQDAIIREIEEELGVILDKENLKFLVSESIENEEYFIYWYEFNLELDKLQLNEGDDMKFFSKNEILKLDNLVNGMKELFITYVPD
jgi:8-oxo-dGTP diphosphatase